MGRTGSDVENTTTASMPAGIPNRAEPPGRVRPRARIRFVNESLALVNGYGTREAIRDLARSAPVWATISKGWVVTPHRARQLVAWLEHRGYDVDTEGASGADRDVHLGVGGDDHLGVGGDRRSASEPTEAALW